MLGLIILRLSMEQVKRGARDKLHHIQQQHKYLKPFGPILHAMPSTYISAARNLSFLARVDNWRHNNRVLRGNLIFESIIHLGEDASRSWR